MAEASARQARRSALNGDFQDAQLGAHRAVELRPAEVGSRQRELLIRRAAETVLRDYGLSPFPDTLGPGRGNWWEFDLLSRVRGGDDGVTTVQAPLIMGEIARSVVEDVYVVGIYQPWHVGGPVPLFTQYIRALKPGGETLPYAAMLLRPGAGAGNRRGSAGYSTCSSR